MPMNPHPVSLFEVAKRAIEICDPDDRDQRLGDLLAQFEDDDEPIRAVENLEERVAIAVEGVDVEIGDPAVSMAAATILYLAHRRDELHDDPWKILRMAARAEWKGDPPEAVVDWLADRGVTVCAMSARDMLEASPVEIELGVDAVAAAIEACLTCAQTCTS